MLQCNITEPEARVLTRQKGCAGGGAVGGKRKTEDRRRIPASAILNRSPPAVARIEEQLTSDFRRLSSVFRFPASRKEVIQPQVPLRLPCYDFTPVADLTVVGYPLLRGWRTGFG